MKKPEFETLTSPTVLCDWAAALYPWLPPWISWALTVPFIFFLGVVAITEYAVRALITPARYWK